jgi:hypothetical protein
LKITKLASTVILIASFATIYLFGLIFYIYKNADSQTLSTLKDSLSTTSGFFGGIATLVAAYIASKLFNRWEDQHNKQVNSDFIMKLYDCLFEMRQLSTSSVGFIRNYLTKENKSNYVQQLRENNQRLCYLIDYSALKLSDVAYVITEDDYENIFSKQITIITNKLYDLNELYKIFLETDNPDTIHPIYKQLEDINQIDTSLEETLIDLNARYRAFLVELKKYYMA